MPTTLDRRHIWIAFIGTCCDACGCHKRPRNGFCQACYFRLPKSLQSALWRRFFDGFEEAYNEALEWLREH